MLNLKMTVEQLIHLKVMEYKKIMEDSSDATADESSDATAKKGTADSEESASALASIRSFLSCFLTDSEIDAAIKSGFPVEDDSSILDGGLVNPSKLLIAQNVSKYLGINYANEFKRFAFTWRFKEMYFIDGRFFLDIDYVARHKALQDSGKLPVANIIPNGASAMNREGEVVLPCTCLYAYRKKINTAFTDVFPDVNNSYITGVSVKKKSNANPTIFSKRSIKSADASDSSYIAMEIKEVNRVLKEE